MIRLRDKVLKVPDHGRICSCSVNDLRSKTRESRKNGNPKEGYMAAKNWSKGQHFSVSVLNMSRGKILG